MFISDNEIDAALSYGNSVEGGKGRIYAFFQEQHTTKEKADFLKEEYGWGGHSHAVSGATGSYENHDGKGIKLQKRGCEDVQLSWNKVAQRITDLIKKDRYFTPEEHQRYEELRREKAEPEPLPSFDTAASASYDDYSDIKRQTQTGILLYQVGDFFEMYGEDAETAAEALDLNLTFRNISPSIRMAMCGIPSHRLEQYVEKLHDAGHDVVLCGIEQQSGERQVFRLDVPEARKLEKEPEADLPTPAMPPRAEITQDDIDDALRAWNGDPTSKQAVASYMADHARDKDTAAWLSREYGGSDTPALFITRTGTDMVKELPWPKVQRRIAQLIREDKFLNGQEHDHPEGVDVSREASAPSMEDTLAGNLSAVARAVMENSEYRHACHTGLKAKAFAACVNAIKETLPSVEDERFKGFYENFNVFQQSVHSRVFDETYPALSAGREGYPYDVGDEFIFEDDKKYIITRIEGDTVRLMDTSIKSPRLPHHREVTRDELLRLAERFPQEAPEQAPEQAAFPFAVGDTVYLENGKPYIVESVTDMHIQLRDPTLYYPILRAESRESFARLMAQYPQPEQAPAEVQPAAENFRITDDTLGVGGPKAKFRMNMDAINTLRQIELEGRAATPEEQEVLSKYVGWGGLADAFDESKTAWANEYNELQSLLSPEEYAAARASTLNAHYTSPAVIKAIYEAVGNMGFKSGNILEPAMGVGNFFGCLPDNMAGSKLYGVELDSLTGRIAKQLYPQADITVAGFETTDRRDFYDVAVGNVPFGQYQVNDRAYNKLGFSIHDYFFAKSIDQVRPGGVVVFVTSRYTMDKQSPEVRRYIAQRAELLGAIRLPNNAFRANAGTDVVSDIIFLQKRDRPIIGLPPNQGFGGKRRSDGVSELSASAGSEGYEVRDDAEPDWVYLGQNEDGFAINSYFLDHPEMVLGRQTSESTQYGKQDFTVAPIEGLELADQLHDAIKHIGGEYRVAELPDLGEGEAIDTSIPADPDVKNYSYTVVDGEVYFRENSRMVRPDLNETAKGRVRGMVELRDCVRQLIDLQMDEYTPDSAIKEKQAELNRLYDAFSAKYGLINDRGNKLAFADDSSYYLLCSLEVLDDDNNFKRKADMFTKRTIRQQRSVTSVDTAAEALAVSIGERACVDLGFMASLMGGSEKIPQIVEDLHGVIYKTPGSGPFDLEAGGAYWAQGWQTADEYLSGNVRQKLREAKRAAEQDPLFQINVSALEKAQPKDLDASEIEVRLGATWIDKEYIQQFMEETFDTPWHLRRNIQVHYSAFTAEWNITGKSSVGYNNIAATVTYGTERANAYRILEDSLNLRDVRIYDTIEDADGKERRVLNAKETTLAAQKQQAIRDAFKDWIWRDPERRQTLVRQYNEEMNSTRPREYDGSHIVFSGMNPEITLREHQKNAIAHVLYGGNTLLAHEVGAGKTFEMVAACMESKRLGLSQKSIFVVPNHLTEQWASEFLRLYPSANLLVTTRKDFETRNRKKFCARIATGDYDAVIIGHSQFERIPISAERQERLLQEQIWEITEGINEVEASGGERFTVKQLERTRKGLEARLEKLQADDRKDDVVTFEQLGCDRMFVDESDNYKNLFLYTKMRNVAGLSTTDAQKSSDMFAKCRYMDELTGNRGVVFATGTPISNSMTEMYTIQRYLQHDRLKEMGMAHFDCWASRFGETTTALELAPEGTGYRARTRFAKFFNLPELMNMFREVADIKTADQLDLPTPEVEYHTIASKPTEHQQAMVQALSERAAKVHAGNVDPTQDNMLKITSDGRKLGLDQRIINSMLPDEPGTKVNECVDNILRFWREGEADKLTQLVFCDISTPRATPSRRAAKAPGGNLDSPEIHALETAIDLPEPEAAFTVYEDIRQKLIAQGIPAEQVAFIHEANTDMRKKELFGKVRSGQVRVLIGSTPKMGAGTNVQDRLIAMHDLDCPWRPRDLTQRKGRIERQGNQNEKVHVCRYVTEGTFDAYLWQTVENKQKFISQIMSSKSPVRSCDDVDETALSFAEIKALCAGDPRIKERMDLDVDVSRLKIMKADHQSKRFRMEDNLLKYFPEQIEQNKGYIRGLEADIKTLAEHPHPKDGFAGMEVRGDRLTDKENAGAALLDACKEVKGNDPVQIGSYRGFAMSVKFDPFEKTYELTLRGSMSHRATLGADPRGNLVRIDNALDRMPERLKDVRVQLENLHQQKEAAEAEVGKPFPQEEELRVKTARLVELDSILNMDNRGGQPEQAIAKSARPSVLDKLKAQPVHGMPDKPRKRENKEMEVL
ncbi:MAG: SNF2-related protein [Sphaerochaetaceae bacterium]|nr:SNF2-related protein [Sphaerochaetaceae bacterium]